jgi:hypothetical protein
LSKAGGARLLLEAAQLVLVVIAGSQDLDRNVSTQFQVMRREDAAHPTAAQLVLHAVATIERKGCQVD